MKKIVTLSVMAALTMGVCASADTDTQAQIDALKAQLEKLEKKTNKNTKKISHVNMLANNDNLKFNVDFRTSYDNLNYKTEGGINPMTGKAQPSEYKTDALYSERLWLGMAYNPTANMIFSATLAAHKAFGASYGQRGTGMGFDTFDWIVNENLTDDTIRLREAYWLWKPTVGGFPMTLSVGRRPSTNGLLINLRDDDKAKSPLGHIINMEFDGASASIKLDKYVEGMYFKICVGRGLTNAASWASSGTAYINPMARAANQPNYTKVDGSLDHTDLAGFIFQPYDDGQYSVIMNYYRGFNVPGMKMNSAYDPTNPMSPMATMETLGNEDGAVISLKSDGIGDGINDFLDDTILFASFAWSQSNPDAGKTMMGSSDKESGTSYWVGTQMPNLTGGRFGLEYNHGSKYWRPFTYGEDTMIGSKMATRGDAYEAYWTQPIVEKDGQSVLSMQVRYTYLDYDYTGSNGFFGDGGTPYKIGSMQSKAMNSVTSAQDIRVYLRYRY